MTTTTAVPVPAGVVAVIWVAESTGTPVAGAPPIVTVAPSTKFSPVMVTTVPPASGPLPGEMPVTTGAGTTLTSVIIKPLSMSLCVTIYVFGSIIRTCSV